MEFSVRLESANMPRSECGDNAGLPNAEVRKQLTTENAARCTNRAVQALLDCRRRLALGPSGGIAFDVATDPLRKLGHDRRNARPETA